MQTQVVEIVRFQLNEGVSEDAFVKAAEASNAFATKQAGFISRSLSKTEDGEWVDHIVWASMDDAAAAGKAFPGDPTTQDLMAAIKPGSVDMQHLVQKMAAA